MGEVIEHHDFIEEGEEAAEILRVNGKNLDYEEKASLLELVDCSEMLKRINSIFPFNFAVANDTANPHVAAYVTTADAKAHMVKSTLLGPFSQVLQIAHHEATHVNDLQNGRKEVDFKKHLPGERHLKALNKVIAPLANDITEVNLIEGLTEYRNIAQHGENCNCAYNHLEVPVVKKLEETAMRVIGLSLVAAFNLSLEIFYRRVRLMCDLLILEEVADRLNRDYLLQRGVKKEDVQKRIMLVKPLVRDEDDAKKTVLKLLNECAEMERVRGVLGLEIQSFANGAPANDNANGGHFGQERLAA